MQKEGEASSALSWQGLTHEKLLGFLHTGHPGLETPSSRPHD